MRAAIVVAGLLAGSGCVKHFECAVHGGAGARSITTDHFVVTSALPEAEHRAQAEQLELLWDTLAAYFHAEVPSARIPVLILEDTEVVERFSDGYAGFVTRRGPDVLVVGAPSEPKQSNVNAHELAHLVSAFMLPRLPHWLSEGLATYFEDATFKDARTVTMGRWNPGRAEEAFHGLATFEELSEWGGLNFDRREAGLYASAWAWVHYLSNRDEARLVRLFEGLRSTRPLAEVMREAFPPAETPALHEAVQAYVRAASFRGFETSLRRQPSLSAPRVLQPYELHLLRSRLFLKSEEARARELEAAKAVAPTPLPAALAVAEAQARGQAVEGLLSSYPEAPEVLLALPTDARAGARAAFEAALAREPESAALLLAVAELFGAEGKLEEAERLTTKGLSLAPWSVQLHRLAFRISVARRRCVEAASRAATIEALLGDDPAGNKDVLGETRTQLAGCAP